MGKIIHLKKARSSPKYKYALNEQLGMLPRNMTINEVVKHLENSNPPITRSEFYRDRDIRFGSESSIPSDRLFIYAKVFDCPVDDLLNQPIKAKSIRQQNLKVKTKLA